MQADMPGVSGGRCGDKRATRVGFKARSVRVGQMRPTGSALVGRADADLVHVEDDVLIGSGSVVLHRAHIHSGSIVAAGAVVRDDTIVPPRSLALGVPAIIKEGVVDPNLFRWNVDMYIQNALNYKSKLRRIN
jgi:serine acetyltransferase